MQRRTFLLALGALAAPGLAIAQAETPEALVRALYGAHSPANNRDGPSVIHSAHLRARFLTPALSGAIARMQERSRRAGGLTDDTLDFDPITDSQDPEVNNLQVRQHSADAERATVTVTFTRGENGRVTLNYILARIDGAWRVYDIFKPPGGGHEGWSLRRLLNMRS